jgi:hypothetical protein
VIIGLWTFSGQAQQNTSKSDQLLNAILPEDTTIWSVA